MYNALCAFSCFLMNYGVKKDQVGDEEGFSATQKLSHLESLVS